LDFEVEIEGVKVLTKVDTGFEGEILLTKEVFDSIPYEPSQGPRVCTVSLECYSTFVKLAKVKYLGKEIIAKVLNSPVIEKNIAGEGFLRKMKVVVDYKDNTIRDP
jgi:clan AA aspartic protease